MDLLGRKNNCFFVFFSLGFRFAMEKLLLKAIKWKQMLTIFFSHFRALTRLSLCWEALSFSINIKSLLILKAFIDNNLKAFIDSNLGNNIKVLGCVRFGLPSHGRKQMNLSLLYLYIYTIMDTIFAVNFNVKPHWKCTVLLDVY